CSGRSFCEGRSIVLSTGRRALGLAPATTWVNRRTRVPALEQHKTMQTGTGPARNLSPTRCRSTERVGRYGPRTTARTRTVPLPAAPESESAHEQERLRPRARRGQPRDTACTARGRGVPLPSTTRLRGTHPGRIGHARSPCRGREAARF